MNPLAFIRQDLASLIYAHWSIRAAFEFVHLGKQGLKHFENVSQSSSASEGGRESLAVYKASTKNRLQCVLYFGSSADVDVAKPEDETTEKRDIVSQNRCSSINISQPGLPDPMDRSSVMHTAQVLEKDGGLFSVPVYDMDQLFHNHPQGLKAIQQQCHRQFPDLNYPSWIGLVESRYSVQAALGLWKLASILPNSGQKK
ncbi:hypothetical protein EDD11_003962 [Mortierella claussenii]|nr:hypothetical protein EDD11_003962 [Mortierella claussenii]